MRKANCGTVNSSCIHKWTGVYLRVRFTLKLYQNVRFMACFYLQTIQKQYRVSQRTVRRWCEDNLISGAYRPSKEKQWRVRKPKDFERWQAEVVKRLGPPRKIDALVLSTKNRPFDFKLRTRGDLGSWNMSQMQEFGITMVDALVALVQLQILEPIQYDPKPFVKGCKDGVRLALCFKSGAGRNYYNNNRIEERLISALRDAGWDAQDGWRERGGGMTEAERWNANRGAVHRHS